MVNAAALVDHDVQDARIEGVPMATWASSY